MYQADIIRKLAANNLEAAVLVLHFGEEAALAVQNGRDARLGPALVTAINRSPQGAQLPSSVAIRFTPIFGPEARRIAFTPQNARAKLAWLRRALKSNVFKSALRGVAGVIVNNGQARVVSLGEDHGKQLLLRRAADALHELQSRSNRGRLAGPYWYRTTGEDVRLLVPPARQPSALQELFSPDAETVSKEDERI